MIDMRHGNSRRLGAWFQVWCKHPNARDVVSEADDLRRGGCGVLDFDLVVSLAGRQDAAPGDRVGSAVDDRQGRPIGRHGVDLLIYGSQGASSPKSVLDRAATRVEVAAAAVVRSVPVEPNFIRPRSAS